MAKRVLMNWPHLHLALNHVPVLGIFFSLVLFLTGMIRRSEEVKRISLWGFVLLALFSIGLKYTGDFAFQALHRESWLDPAIVAKHEDAANRAVTGAVVLGLLAAGDLVLSRRMKTTVTWINGVILVAAVGTFILLLAAANLGGDIRHVEVRSPSGSTTNDGR